MQRYCTELTERLLKSLDKEYNVVDMGAVVDVITALEKTTITKEVLEITRLGKYINELRRKTSNDALAKRAKDLVRRWRGMVLPSAQSTLQPTPADPAPPALNGAKPHSPALRSLKPQSPALRGIKPQSPLMKDTTSSRTQVPSPALSVNSDHSRSPNSTPSKQTITVTSNHRLGPGESPRLGPAATQNHPTEAVPRTHSSNKRLRKDETDNRQLQLQPQPPPPPLPPPLLLPTQSQRLTGTTTYCEPAVKKQRLNGENVSSHFNSQVPSPALEERCISDQFATVDAPVDADSGVSGPKKRGRKKGSKSAKKQPPVEDRVKEKLASISRNPKLKTTQELLADLQARGSTAGVNLGLTPSQNQKKKEPPSTEDILRSSNEQVSKYLRSARSDTPQDGPLQSRLKPGDNGRKPLPPPPTSVKSHREADSDDVERTDAKSKDATERLRHVPTVEEILAKLPPLDPSTIEWSDPEEEEDEDVGDTSERLPRQVTPEDLERLHSRCIEGLNGNFQPKLSSLTSDDDRESLEMEAKVKSLKGMDSACEPSTGNETDTEFREWHEMLARPSYDGQILHILPYVIID